MLSRCCDSSSVVAVCCLLFVQIYNLFLSAGAGVLENPSEPLSWARAMEEGMKAIMK